MKFLIALALVGLATNTIGYQYDRSLIEQLLGNSRLIGSYADCLLGKGSCTSEGTTLKKKMPELIETSCSKCSEQDKSYAAQLTLALKKYFPEKYEALVNQYDPAAKRRGELDQFLAKYGS